MRISSKVALASAGMLMLAACSESGTNPTTTEIQAPSFAVGDTPTPPVTAAVGTLVVCKTGNVGGSFAITRQAVGASTGTTVASPATIATGTCLEVANDFGGDQVGSNVQVTEAAAANTVQTITACRFKGAASPEVDCTYTNGGNIFLNSFHGYVITYDNQFTPPPSGCTFTKGWYRNNGLGTVTAQDGRTLADTKTILQATPGKPLNVNFGGDNLLLNLYQQYLSALLNGGASGPTDVVNALADVANGTGGSGLTITTTLTQTEISALTTTLTNFNEGTFPNFPHCS